LIPIEKATNNKMAIQTILIEITALFPNHPTTSNPASSTLA
jgi:hypothetical protein